jgi:hypothetical protein
MGRADYRAGKAPILTAGELADLLPIPLLMVVLGYAGPIYPRSDRSNPAPAVGIVGTKTVPDQLKPRVSQILPVWIHWTQWRDVVVPLISDDRITDWSGVLRDLGDLLNLPVDVRSPSGSIAYMKGASVGNLRNSTETPGGLYAPVDGDARELVGQISLLLNKQATAEGY